jgi:hypothetical protein
MHVVFCGSVAASFTMPNSEFIPKHEDANSSICSPISKHIDHLVLSDIEIP